MKRLKKEKLSIYFVYIVLTLASAALLLVAFWMFYPYKTITQEPKPFKLVGSNVTTQGGVISYEYSYCKYTDKQATVSKQFVDGLTFQSEDIATVLDKGCGHVHRQINIPETLPPGEYKMRIIAVYDMNPLRQIEIVNETEEFKVLAQEK
jgi:hypothetical protein